MRKAFGRVSDFGLSHRNVFFVVGVLHWGLSKEKM